MAVGSPCDTQLGDRSVREDMVVDMMSGGFSAAEVSDDILLLHISNCCESEAGRINQIRHMLYYV